MKFKLKDKVFIEIANELYPVIVIGVCSKDNSYCLAFVKDYKHYSGAWCCDSYETIETAVRLSPDYIFDLTEKEFEELEITHCLFLGERYVVSPRDGDLETEIKKINKELKMSESEDKVDYLGNKLKVGDRVVFIERDYRNFMTGTIVKLNEKKATIEFKQDKVAGLAVRDYTAIIKANK